MLDIAMNHAQRSLSYEPFTAENIFAMAVCEARMNNGLQSAYRLINGYQEEFTKLSNDTLDHFVMIKGFGSYLSALIQKDSSEMTCCELEDLLEKLALAKISPVESQWLWLSLPAAELQIKIWLILIKIRVKQSHRSRDAERFIDHYLDQIKDNHEIQHIIKNPILIQIIDAYRAKSDYIRSDLNQIISVSPDLSCLLKLAIPVSRKKPSIFSG